MDSTPRRGSRGPAGEERGGMAKKYFDSEVRSLRDKLRCHSPYKFISTALPPNGSNADKYVGQQAGI
jgi:hypothetical protein